jgi:hypothetical protein
MSTKLECSINPAVLATCFDHKPVYLTFAKKELNKHYKKKLRIYESTLRDPDLDTVIWFAVLETYLIHLELEPDLERDRDRSLELCGTVRKLLRDAGLDINYYYNDVSEETINLRNSNLIRIKTICDSMPVELAYNFNLSILDDLFMEVLLNNLRNEVTSYQAFIEKFKLREFEILNNKLATCTDMDNRDLIESAIARLSETRIRDRLLHSSIYNVVNNEKMTPQFLKLAKISSNTGSLSSLRNGSGAAFSSETELKNYVVTEYEKIYGKEGPDVSVDDIVNFLGPDIADHEIVRNSRLPEPVKNELEADLSLEELDNAMHSAKLSSAGGMDGLNNRALRKFWKVIRQPLCNYAKKITVTGTLTDTFSTASIKLIPKKGNLSEIKNWRPISLLNCIYKIISCAVNNRLQKVSSIVLSRAQKGFIKNRYIQECLINTIEKISYCNTNELPALVVAIDQSRAFDTISHSYMKSVFKFFNFGDKFISLMTAIGTGRKACFLWEDGTYSPKFELKTGRAQGDGPSPLQYNFGEQILLFKLELDPGIEPAFASVIDQARLPVPVHWFRSESNKKTTKIEALADDTTAIIKCCPLSLANLKNNLTRFGVLSGLKCNDDKTNIMPVGGIINLPFENSTGFEVSEKIKLLGMTIDNKLECLNTVHEATYEKIVNITRFWS